MNQQYDQRIAEYRNDGSLNRWERDRRKHGADQERLQRSRSSGTGLVVGGIAGVLVGVLTGH